MFKAFDFCIPTRATAVPDGPDWLHEVKYDGYRLRLERDGDRVRLLTRGGYNWTDRYPWIVEAALKNRHRQFVIDGEAVVLGVDGVADFNALHSRLIELVSRTFQSLIPTSAESDQCRKRPVSDGTKCPGSQRPEAGIQRPV
jgi:ATP-dependent DNA ligase